MIIEGGTSGDMDISSPDVSIPVQVRQEDVARFLGNVDRVQLSECTIDNHRQPNECLAMLIVDSCLCPQEHGDRPTDEYLTQQASFATWRVLSAAAELAAEFRRHDLPLVADAIDGAITVPDDSREAPLQEMVNWAARSQTLLVYAMHFLPIKMVKSDGAPVILTTGLVEAYGPTSKPGGFAFLESWHDEFYSDQRMPSGMLSSLGQLAIGDVTLFWPH